MVAPSAGAAVTAAWIEVKVALRQSGVLPTTIVGLAAAASVTSASCAAARATITANGAMRAPAVMGDDFEVIMILSSCVV